MRTSLSDLKRRLTETNMVRHSAKCHWSGDVTNGEFALMLVSKPKESMYYFMTFEILALVVEQFWHVYWISYCKWKIYLVSKGDIFTPFCYKFIQVTA